MALDVIKLYYWNGHFYNKLVDIFTSSGGRICGTLWHNVTFIKYNATLQSMMLLCKVQCYSIFIKQYTIKYDATF